MPFEEWMNLEVMFDPKAKIAQVRTGHGRGCWQILTEEETRQLFDMVGEPTEWEYEE